MDMWPEAKREDTILSTPSIIVDKSPYLHVKERSGGHCEAMVYIPIPEEGQPRESYRVIPSRCGARPIEIHHRITRARGGEILDNWGETLHLMALCRACHSRAHDESEAFDEGLLIQGRVISGVNGEPVYEGEDVYFKSQYGEKER